MCVPSSSITEISCPFPKRCFCLACFKLLLFSMASMICFFVMFTDVLLHLLPNRLADLRIFNVVCWCAIPLHLPALLSQLFGTCWQLVGFLTFVSASYWNGSFMNHLRSCVNPRVKIVWWNGCKCCESILDFDLEFSPIMLQLTCIYLFRLPTIFALSNLVLILAFPLILRWSLPVLRLLMTETSRKMSGLSVMM